MNQLSLKLITIIKSNGYKLLFADIPGLAYFIPEDKAILMHHSLLLENNPDFAVAHELAHLMCRHEELASLYTCSPVHRSKMEYQANYMAVSMLIEEYIEETSIEFERINYLKFMEYKDIPTSLIHCVEGVYKDLSKKYLEVV